MANTLSDFFKVDYVDDHASSDINTQISVALFAEFSNPETITTTRELVDNDTPIQLLTASTTDTIVELPVEDVTNHAMFILNAGASTDYDLIINNDSSTETFAQLPPDAWVYCFPDGSDWHVISSILGGGEAATEVTVDTGVLTLTKSIHSVQPESGTADDVDTINAAPGAYLLFISDEGTDTITYKHGTGNIDCFGAADIAQSNGAALVVSDGTTVYIAGGGGGGTGITQSLTTDSPTTDTVINCTLSDNINYHLYDISGLANNVTFTLTPGTKGQRVGVGLTVGDPDYVMIIAGDTDTTINGGAVGTEWSRIFIENEFAEFVLDSTSNWELIHDGRIPCSARMSNSSDQVVPTDVVTLLEYNTEDWDIGDLVDLANEKFTIRRDGTYFITNTISVVLNDQDRLGVFVYLSTDTLFREDRYVSSTGLVNIGATLPGKDELSVGDDLYMYMIHSYGSDVTTLKDYRKPIATIREEL